MIVILDTLFLKDKLEWKLKGRFNLNKIFDEFESTYMTSNFFESEVNSY